ncbi:MULTISPECIES: metal-dependent transcriptional regulator [Gordonia]|jgi:DtxR family Mn-dependent transcriptional regulator|uniref:metal-dependent transcriptional regulator n=1 Tax=Gordonia TaxID=2053 RepID=UPI000B2A280A|nr:MULTISPECIES: metal-dependent transcriptional regulator [Gordonia]MDH3006398.1 metal-dependent transcriptional regulator [Gordonia alkanivorans]MDH3009716.1 metal-dependent transcriptional regulator [Gordonia alkanivorans]MDH3014157.1 metal-dependent transcriptional regulator [Gordonia alkanivorans]MDH3018737.1 metal-dependent transcriptional regulator [Gordonia alkanivorans]MDH3023263.1 metal-dependent transcriptional regulator [Gordonia alkanivorans]
MPWRSDRPVTELSQVTQDYLKVIWTSQEWEDVKVTTKLLAQSLGVSPSTASEAIRKLADQGLVSHEPYGAVTLTDHGREAAILMVRRHRLIETFLVRELGYRWDEVHDEAEILEHAVSDRLMARLDAKLGFPDRDPHGDPIPALDGSIPTPAAALLADLEVGASGCIARISDTDPEMLRYFDEVGVALDRVVTVAEKRPFAGTISVSLDDAAPIDLGDIAARAIFVVPR